MKVSEAVMSRISTRGFLDKPVPLALVREVLETAKFAPSGGNLQPWLVWVAAGARLDRLRARMRETLGADPRGGQEEYKVYPPDLWEPYRTRRYQVGEAMYEKLGIPREDRAARLARLAENYNLFGAPVGLFFAMDRRMQEGQWADLGMFMQTIMLVAREKGLHTCAQEAWARWHQEVRAEFGIPDSCIFFSGMAMGWMDENEPVNTLRSERAPLEEFTTFLGFDDDSSDNAEVVEKETKRSSDYAR